MVNGILVEGNIGSLGSLDNPLVVHRSHDLHRHYRCHCLYEGINQGMCETVCFSNGDGDAVYKHMLSHSSTLDLDELTI